MAIKLYKNEKESLDRFISRFNKKVQGSRLLLEVRTRRYHKKSPTKRLLRASAVKREFYRTKRDKMQYY